MQIFSPSPTQRYASCGNSRNERGFTLVELLISIAIIGLVSSVILVKYNSFDSTVLLKAAAYEIAISLREVQVKSVSVSPSSNSFDNPYGIYFTPTNGASVSKSYTVYTVTQGTDNPPRRNPPNSTDISIGGLSRTMNIADLCVTVGGVEDCAIDSLDVAFRRPEFRALFYAVRSGGAGTYTTTITNAKIKVGPPSATNKCFVVTVSQLGQISVGRENC